MEEAELRISVRRDVTPRHILWKCYPRYSKTLFQSWKKAPIRPYRRHSKESGISAGSTFKNAGKHDYERQTTENRCARRKIMRQRRAVINGERSSTHWESRRRPTTLSLKRDWRLQEHRLKSSSTSVGKPEKDCRTACGENTKSHARRVNEEKKDIFTLE